MDDKNDKLQTTSDSGLPAEAAAAAPGPAITKEERDNNMFTGPTKGETIRVEMNFDHDAGEVVINTFTKLENAAEEPAGSFTLREEDNSGESFEHLWARIGEKLLEHTSTSPQFRPFGS